MQECSPTTMRKVLKWPAEIVQHALIEIGLFAVGTQRPEQGWYRFQDLTEFVFAFLQCLLGPLSLLVLDPQRCVGDFQSLVGFVQRLTGPHMITLFVSNSRHEKVDDE